jgi:hypothetical protein
VHELELLRDRPLHCFRDDRRGDDGPLLERENIVKRYVLADATLSRNSLFTKL